jgi:hypothetical protein
VTGQRFAVREGELAELVRAGCFVKTFLPATAIELDLEGPEERPGSRAEDEKTARVLIALRKSWAMAQAEPVGEVDPAEL